MDSITDEHILSYRDKHQIITARPDGMSYEAYKIILSVQNSALKKYKKGTIQFVSKNFKETSKGTTKVNKK